jgi:alpha/beta hydrolase fold
MAAASGRAVELARATDYVIVSVDYRLAPDRFLTATSDHAPETASEDRSRNAAKPSHLLGVGHDSARRRGLGTAILDRRNRRQRVHPRTCGLQPEYRLAGTAAVPYLRAARWHDPPS